MATAPSEEDLELLLDQIAWDYEIEPEFEIENEELRMAFEYLRDNKNAADDITITSPFVQLAMLVRPALEAVLNPDNKTSAVVLEITKRQIKNMYRGPMPSILPAEQHLSAKQLHEVFFAKLAYMFGIVSTCSIPETFHHDLSSILNGDPGSDQLFIKATILVFTAATRCLEKGVVHYAGKHFQRAPMKNKIRRDGEDKENE
ncbi:hypothetical protein AJ78_03958 [Emergomyces pasteurianus Ep9510]|uniref:Uncharacterized protein n=1 Tax=Emergomyces pasteurianus Ep9510 TaxID=1447872 RepID=A0A1J9PHB3_9EURO|nr:hypothetical protein AJ78_03958 [Emergomyces pasteurianus Ep9510]